MSNRARIDLSDFDETPPNKDPNVLRQISENAGFPSRPAAPPLPTPAAAPAEGGGFRRPARQVGNRTVAINVRVSEETARKLYALRDDNPAIKRGTIADVLDDAIAALYGREFSDG